jgi:hypothetical protein
LYYGSGITVPLKIELWIDTALLFDPSTLSHYGARSSSPTKRPAEEGRERFHQCSQFEAFMYVCTFLFMY